MLLLEQVENYTVAQGKDICHHPAVDAKGKREEPAERVVQVLKFRKESQPTIGVGAGLDDHIRRGGGGSPASVTAWRFWMAPSAKPVTFPALNTLLFNPTGEHDRLGE